MQLHREEGAIRSRGADLVFIGSGGPGGAAAFQGQIDPETKVFSAPPETYRAVGMRRGVVATLGSGRLLAGLVRKKLRALTGGGGRSRSGAGATAGRESPPAGDRWQLGGVLIVNPGGELAYEYRSRRAGDHPRPEAILGALAQPRGPRAPEPRSSAGAS